MGRTIQSFCIAGIEEEENEWKLFRNLLDKSDRKLFDRMFSISYLYNSACSYSVKPVRLQPILLMSIIFHHYKQIMKMYTRLLLVISSIKFLAHLKEFSLLEEDDLIGIIIIIITINSNKSDKL
jgi:hypothetical protein